MELKIIKGFFLQVQNKYLPLNFQSAASCVIFFNSNLSLFLSVFYINVIKIMLTFTISQYRTSFKVREEFPNEIYVVFSYIYIHFIILFYFKYTLFLFLFAFIHVIDFTEQIIKNHEQKIKIYIYKYIYIWIYCYNEENKFNKFHSYFCYFLLFLAE